ncbi:hypothetical protein [Psychroserpens sp. SPM9]|uniref:hypothetical protein n=1 Tax=Psychroserpens sp. SPM9 TaxID=2975598 RepID=UPI0021A5E6E9|nr:hypothetical protein [Psychroserpens sp. SPM9]MDG5490270.1 hypothetical protein [Psychroserpens sp. SPM9]
MKTKSITFASFLIVCLIAFTSVTTIQDPITIEVVYDGKEDYGYNFIGIDEEKEEYMITFQEIEEAALKAYDLNSNKFYGAKFSVTYITKMETVEDEDGYEEEIETNVITALKKL